MNTKLSALALSCSVALLSFSSYAEPNPNANISDGVVKIGVLTDINGPFLDNVGKGSIVATEIAVEEFGGEVLGYPIEIVTADHQNKADIGAARVREWIDRQNVDAITELGNSAVALAAMKIAEDKNKISIVTGAGGLSIANENCTPNNLHWVYDTYALAKVGTQSLVKQGLTNWYYLTADYTFGHSLESDGKRFIEDAGGQVVGSSRYPFPGSDFSSYILLAQSSDADAVAIATAGLDLQNAIKQGNEFGLTDTGQTSVAMLMSIVDVHGVGLDDAQGMMFAETFYWDLDDESRAFAEKFQERMGRMPTALQAGQYSAILNYLKAIEKAESDDVADVMKAIKSMEIEDAFAKNGYVREDGKMIHDIYLVEVKSPEESEGNWDYYKVIETVPGDEAFYPLEESKCNLIKQ